MIQKIAYAIARLLAAIIMLQTLYFKFSGSMESVYIFKTVGLEPIGRWGIGILELIASVLLIVPRTAWLGGLMGASLMLGAVGMHLTILGIEVMNDGGYLFKLAVIVILCSLYVIFVNKRKILDVIPKLLNRR